MSIVKEFREFAMKGSVIDLAVGVIIGAAFGKIVSSLVNDILMPPIGLLLGGLDFSSLSITLREAADKTPGVAVRYGVFVNNVIDFIIVALCIFLVIRAMNALRRKEAAPTAVAAPTEKECPECAMKVPVAARRCAHCSTVFAK
ncbi:MAG TPA: large-conductance mechanosensitive channel protein MscL [Bacteroidota bacterium]|nr:large-conductance mechanosensitive channel protein MscL [Bacteroidota bacterium]